MTLNSPNPYAPPQTQSHNTRHQCPICGHWVGFARFALPFGHCGRCGNYLAIRHWDRRSLSWTIAILAIILGPTLAEFLGFQTRWFPTGRLIMIWMALHIIHDKTSGCLVPAVCWGLFALRDDDRLTDDSRPRS